MGKVEDEDDPPKTIVVRESDILMVLEEGEFCCVCEIHKDLMRFGIGDPADPLVFTVCNPCFAKNESGDSRFHHWFVGEVEKSLAARPDEWRKNPDSTWGKVGEP